MANIPYNSTSSSTSIHPVPRISEYLFFFRYLVFILGPLDSTKYYLIARIITQYLAYNTSCICPQILGLLFTTRYTIHHTFFAPHRTRFHAHNSPSASTEQGEESQTKLRHCACFTRHHYTPITYINQSIHLSKRLLNSSQCISCTK